MCFVKCHIGKVEAINMHINSDQDNLSFFFNISEKVTYKPDCLPTCSFAMSKLIEAFIFV